MRGNMVAANSRPTRTREPSNRSFGPNAMDAGKPVARRKPALGSWCCPMHPIATAGHSHTFIFQEQSMQTEPFLRLSVQNLTYCRNALHVSRQTFRSPPVGTLNNVNISANSHFGRVKAILSIYCCHRRSDSLTLVSSAAPSCNASRRCLRIADIGGISAASAADFAEPHRSAMVRSGVWLPVARTAWR